MSRYHLLVLSLIVAGVLVFTMPFATSAQELDSTALLVEMFAPDATFHLVPATGPIELWRFEGNYIVEGWCDAVNFERIQTFMNTQAAQDEPTQATDITLNFVPQEGVSIWRNDGSKIVEGWVTSPADR